MFYNIIKHRLHWLRWPKLYLFIFFLNLVEYYTHNKSYLLANRSICASNIWSPYFYLQFSRPQIVGLSFILFIVRMWEGNCPEISVLSLSAWMNTGALHGHLDDQGSLKPFWMPDFGAVLPLMTRRPNLSISHPIYFCKAPLPGIAHQPQCRNLNFELSTHIPLSMQPNNSSPTGWKMRPVCAVVKQKDYSSN